MMSFSSPSSIFAAVDLPEPDSPTSASVEPFGTVNDALSTAVNWVDEKLPVRILKTLVASMNSIVGGASASRLGALGGERQVDPGGSRARQVLDRLVAVHRRLDALARRGSGAAATRRWVYGCFGFCRISMRRPGLDDLAAVHDDDVLGTLGGETQVVRDEDHGGVLLRRQRLEVVEDAALHGHVERRGRLVGDQQLRVGREPDADQHALAHAARELVRVLPEPAVGILQARLAQHLDGALAHVALVLGEAVGTDRLLDLEADVPHRVEALHRVLRHEADQATAHRLDLGGLQLREVAALEQDLTAGDATAAREAG